MLVTHQMKERLLFRAHDTRSSSYLTKLTEKQQNTLSKSSPDYPSNAHKIASQFKFSQKLSMIEKKTFIEVEIVFSKFFNESDYITSNKH